MCPCCLHMPNAQKVHSLIVSLGSSQDHGRPTSAIGHFVTLPVCIIKLLEFVLHALSATSMLGAVSWSESPFFPRLHVFAISLDMLAVCSR